MPRTAMNEIIGSALGGALLGITILTVIRILDHLRRHRRGSNKPFINGYKAGFTAAAKAARPNSGAGAKTSGSLPE